MTNLGETKTVKYPLNTDTADLTAEFAERDPDITRELEMVKAFRDTWHDGIHSYLGYMRDRLTVARDLLAESGSCFVQIGDANVHKVRAVMEEVFGEENFVSQIAYRTTTGRANDYLAAASNYLLWFAKNKVYDAFKKFLSNDIDREEWDSVAKTTSRPFPRPKTGHIAVKVINRFGDEVMKVFEV